MDGDGSTSTSTSSGGGGSKNWILIAVVVIAIIILVLGGGYYYMNSQKQNTVVESESPTPDSSAMEESGATPEAQASTYNDGTYTAEGTYNYHSGTEAVRVTVTLKEGVVEDVTVVSLAKAPTSKTMQADFIANYKTMVVGKNIDDLSLGKVSGSSLTPLGFNAAVEDIKTQAQS